MTSILTPPVLVDIVSVSVTSVGALSFVKFTPDINTVFTKIYTLKSLNNIINDVVTVTNISQNIRLNVRFESLHPSIVVSDVFTLAPGQSRDVTIKYSNVQLERVVPFAGTFGSAINIYVGEA